MEQADEDLESDQVRFVDDGPFFDGRRWCGNNDDLEVHEPNPDNATTWFFLSAWKDVDASSVLSLLPGGDAANVRIPYAIDPTISR